MDTLFFSYDFDKNIEALLFSNKKSDSPPIKGFLLFPFELTEDIVFNDLIIKKTFRVNIVSRYHSFISEVEIPSNRLERSDAYLQVLSAALTFCFSKLIRPSFQSENYSIKNEAGKIGIQHVIEMHAGHISEEDLKMGIHRFYDLVDKLNKVQISDYKNILQSIRLIYLNHHAIYLDINLAYTLVVGSIENLASSYIKRKDPSLKREAIELNEDDKIVQDFCLNNNLDEWFKLNILHHKKLKVKFIEFILRYAPFEKWYELKDRNSTPLKPPLGYEHLFDKDHFTEEYIKARRIEDKNYHPEELDISQIKKLLDQTYNYRSRFIHNGIGIPIEKDGRNRFFDWLYDFDKNHQCLTVNYDCLLLISKISIFELMNSILPEQFNR